MRINKPKKKKEISRYLVFNVIMGIIFAVIIAKLIYIQVYKGQEYADRADISSTRFVAEKAPRGKIYDSEGNLLATNIQTYALTYTKAEETEEDFYKTIDSVLEILSENGETFQDGLLLKIDKNGKFYFDFKTDDAEARKAVELRFKKDRGFEDEIKKKDFPNKQGDFSDAELSKINNELMKITPEETFYELVKMYNMYDLINSNPTNDELKAYEKMTGKEMTNLINQKYSNEEIRKYMVIKDAVKMQSFKGYRSVTIASNIKKDTAFIIYQKLNDLPGIDVVLEPIRYYPYKNLASSVIGYVSPIDSSKQENYELRGYDVSSDLIGVSGIESSFENELRGIKGGTTVKVNSKGRETEKLFELETYPGNNVHLTIDKDVQYAAQEAMKDTLERIRKDRDRGHPNATRGAAVALEVNTGRVIAMVSYPDYDPNLFSVPGRLSAEESQKYFNPDLEKFYAEHKAATNAQGTLDQLFPKNISTGVREDKFDLYPRSFFNYATQGLVTPGSVFKPLTSYAGLKEGVITTNETIDDKGKYIKKGIFDTAAEAPQCMAVQFGYTHGPTDLRKALEVSCNYYYYEVGYRLYEKHGSDVVALNSLAKYAWEFGLGVDPDSNKSASTGIEITENFGQTYNFESWKNSKINSALFYLVPELEKGRYGGYEFAPFDIGYLEDDEEGLKNAKQELKDKIKSRLEQAGVDEAKMDFGSFSEYIQDNVKKIMNLSNKYKENLDKYNTDEKNKSIEKQAIQVSNAIAQFTVSDMTSQITTPAELITDSIGQSMNTFTPIQLASYTATLANGGTRYDVNLVDRVTSPTGEVIKEYKPEVINKIDIDPSFLQAIKDGMYRTSSVESSGYTYQLFGNFPIKVAGKTGTADFGVQENYDFQGRNAYSNYISFAPLDKPEIAVFVSVYDGKNGSNSASVAKAIYEAYFKEKLLEIDPNYASKSPTFKKYVLDSPLKDNKDKDILSDESNDGKKEQ